MKETKKHTWKRILALMLAMVMVCALAACGGKSGDDDEDESNGKLNTGTNDAVVDMDGYEFTIASNFLLDEPVLSEITASEAIFEEVRHQVEKDYNCKITILPLDVTVENVRSKVIAGDKIADVIDVSVARILPMARAGYIVPLESVSGLDLEDSRWVKGYTNLTEFNGQHYGVNFMLPAEARSVMIYNRDLLKQCGITEDPQELMKKGEWTFDKLKEMCKKITKDNNGDGTTDTYGMYFHREESFGLDLILANGASLVKTVDGVAKENYNTPEAITALNYLYDLVNTDKTAVYSRSGGQYSSEQTVVANFVAGKYGFFACESWMINQNIKPICGDLNYGLVSLPKGPNADNYVCPSQNARNFCITSTNKDTEKTVTILNALARYLKAYGGEENWWHFDLEKDYFQEGDQASVEAYVTCLDNATVDLGVGVTDLWKTFQEVVIKDSIFNNKGTPASRIDSITGKYQSAIDAIYN